MSTSQILGISFVCGTLFVIAYAFVRLRVSCSQGRVLVLYREKDLQQNKKITKFRIVMPGQSRFRSPWSAVAILGTHLREPTFQVIEAYALGGREAFHLEVVASFQIATESGLLEKAIKRFGGRPAINVDNSIIDLLDQTMRKHMVRIPSRELLAAPEQLTNAVLDECKPIARNRGVHLRRVEVRKFRNA